MAWKVELRDSVLKDLRWFGKKQARGLIKAANSHLLRDPTAKTKTMKDLRPNPLAQRELRLFGKYRVLFNVDEETELVTILVIGEKRGNALLVQGEEFTGHHEKNSAK